jgi:hypothetical protein
MHCSKLIALGLLALPLAGCRTDTERYNDNYNRDNNPPRDTRYDQTYYNDHRPTDHTEHANAADTGSGQAGTVTFNRLTGNMSTTIEAGMDKAQRAAEKALEDLHYTITDKKLEDNKSVIEARSADKDKVKVTLERRTDRMSDLTIGVGMTGKESAGDLILEKMMENMK